MIDLHKSHIDFFLYHFYYRAASFVVLEDQFLPSELNTLRQNSSFSEWSLGYEQSEVNLDNFRKKLIFWTKKYCFAPVCLSPPFTILVVIKKAVCSRFLYGVENPGV